jgi:hypothetical protein
VVSPPIPFSRPVGARMHVRIVQLIGHQENAWPRVVLADATFSLDRANFQPTTQPTECDDVRLTRRLAVPAVLYVVVKPNHATLITARAWFKSTQAHHKSPVFMLQFSLFPFSRVPHKAFLSTICQLFDWPNYTNLRLGLRPLLHGCLVKSIGGG